MQRTHVGHMQWIRVYVIMDTYEKGIPGAKKTVL